jgi:hypothetical protein
MRKIYVRFNRLAVGKNVFGPDEMAMDTEEGASVGDVLMTIWNTKFLPDVRAYRVAWVALHEGRPLALLARGLRSPILFTNGKAPLSDYIGKGSPLFFMADLGRKDSRAALSSFGRKVGEGGDASEAMNDVLESYLMINRQFSGGIKIALQSQGGAAGCGGFVLHSAARLSDAVYCIYRTGCLSPREGGEVWALGSRRGALAVLAREWAGSAHALYLFDQDAELGALFNDDETVELTLINALRNAPDEVFMKLKGQGGENKLDENGFINRFKDRF